MLSKSFLANYSKKFAQTIKILFPRAYFFRKIASFNLAWHRSKVQLAPPTENIHGTEDGGATSEIGYSR